MRLFYSILIFCILPAEQVHAQITISKDTVLRVTFRLYSPDLPDSTNVFITGSLPGLGNWNPSAIRMIPEGRHTWMINTIAPNPSSIEYKFTLGSWDREAVDADGNPYPNFVLNAVTDTAARINILYWGHGSRPKKLTGKITGQVKYFRQVKNQGLLPRDIIVWLPPGYKKNKKERYPVLYMQDGQNIIDPATSAFGTDWGVDEACDSLIKNKIIEPLIVVGIYNTRDRSLEYTPGDTGDSYMHFVVSQAKPMIDRSFRTLSDRDHTLAGGSSAGALVSFMLAWEYPDIFSYALCFSPAFKILQINYVNVVRQTDDVPTGTFFYIYNGGVGLDSELQPGVDEMLAALKGKGYREGVDYFYVNDPAGRHTESDWAKEFPRAIVRCLESK